MEGTKGRKPTGGTPPAGNGIRAAAAVPAVQPFLSGKESSGEDIGLRQYLRLFHHHFKLMISVGVLPLAVVNIYTFMQPKRYKAQAVVLRIEEQSASEAKNQGVGLMPLKVAMHELRTGRLTDKIEEKLKRLGDENVPLAAELVGMLQTTADEGSQELTVVATGTGPERVAAVANACAEVLVENANRRHDADRGARVEDAKRDFEKKSAELAEVTKAILEEHMKSSTGEGPLLPLPGEVEDVTAQLRRLEGRKQDAMLQLKELDERIVRLSKSIKETSVSQPRVDLSNLERSLVQAELALAQAEVKYHETHPTYQKLQGERDELFKIIQRKIEERGTDAGTQPINDLQHSLALLSAEKAGVEARIAALEGFIKEKRSSMAGVVSGRTDNSNLADLVRKQKLIESNVATLQKNFEMAEGLETSESGKGPRWLVLNGAKAPDPDNYFSPRWSLSLALGVALALALGFLSAFIAENLEDRIRDQGDLLQRFRLPFLGPVPLRGDGEGLLISLDQPRSMIASIFEVLRNNINYALPAGVPKVVLVGSGVVGEGKSTIAANLAISYCLDGNNVLLIDTDLRRPRAHRLFENLCPEALNSPGLAGYLSGRATLEDVELRTGVPNLSFISAGKGAVNPSKLLGSAEMRRLMEHTARHYDVVVLDGPAVLPVVDSTVVSQFASGVVLVVSCMHAPAEQVATAIARLQHVRAPIVGMILNRVSTGSRSYGYYGYYGSRYGYGYGYGYHSPYHEKAK